MSKVFNADQYKKTTQAQWDDAAEAWHRWGPLLKRWLGPATQQMFDMANIQPGSSVLDVAAGAGEQTIEAAKRVGPTGSVLATDLSAKILEFAQKSANQEGISWLATRQLDGENLKLLAGQEFDAVISRVGLIYFPDQQKALTGMKDSLKMGGRISVMVYATAEENAFFSIPVSIIRRRAQLPPPLPGQPGPFSLGKVEVLQKALTDVGFKQVKVEKINAPVRLDSALECLQFEQESFGALHQMLSGLSADEQDDAWEEIEQVLTKFEQDGQFSGPCEMLVASGVK
ncbi:MAG: methyltransferase domain-containing protein [Enterobacterales bacterium]|nr:methyltransferase domain-containing protein [Enterobacterales bacterium]